MTLIVVCGLQREARIIERPDRDVLVVVGGGVGERLVRDLDAVAAECSAIVLSAGLAGALDPSLAVGDVVIDGDPAVLALLARALPLARVGPVVGADAVMASAAAKRRLAASGAVAVDMESHHAAGVARRRGLPFGVVRTISDDADATLPPAALVGMRPDGGVALAAILRSLCRAPGQLPALIATGRNAGRAIASLRGAFDALYAAGLDRVDAATLTPRAAPA